MATDKATHPAGTRVRIMIHGAVITDTCTRTLGAHDLLTLLRLLLSVRDLNYVEKAARLPRGLSMDGVPDGDDPDVGGIG